MESWVDIKKDNLIIKVPYRAYLDVFEGNGFEILDKSLSAKPTFSYVEEATSNKEKKIGTSTNKPLKEVADANKTNVPKRQNQAKNIK